MVKKTRSERSDIKKCFREVPPDITAPCEPFQLNTVYFCDFRMCNRIYDST